MGPPDWQLIVCEIDLRVGGKWRFVPRPDGVRDGPGGVYQGSPPPDRIVQTEIYDQDWTGGRNPLSRWCSPNATA